MFPFALSVTVIFLPSKMRFLRFILALKQLRELRCGGLRYRYIMVANMEPEPSVRTCGKGPVIRKLEVRSDSEVTRDFQLSQP